MKYSLQSPLQRVPIRSLHRVSGPGWQLDASPSSALLLGGNGPFPPLRPLHSPFGTLASTGTLTFKERALEFDTADIPQLHNSWSKFHQAKWFQELLQIRYRSLKAIPFFVPPWKQREDYFHHNIITNDLVSLKLDQTNPLYSHLVTDVFTPDNRVLWTTLFQNNEISIYQSIRDNKDWIFYENVGKQKVPRGAMESESKAWYIILKISKHSNGKAFDHLCYGAYYWALVYETIYSSKSIHTLTVCIFCSYHFFQQ